MARTPREVAERIGYEYVQEFPVTPPSGYETPHDVMTYWSAVRAFDKMAEVNDTLFRDIPVDVVFQEEDPYGSYEEMAQRVLEEDTLRVFNGGAPHPIWDHHVEVTSRAVHDWYGHLKLEVPFTAIGEYRKWEDARTHYPAYCDRWLFTEIIGQLGAAFYLEGGFDDDQFEQKVFPAPARWIDQMSLAVEEAES